VRRNPQGGPGLPSLTSVKFIDWPRPVDPGDYERAVQEIAERLARQPGFLSLYQIGHCSHPGISDLDLIAVFADGAECKQDVRSGLSSPSAYVLVHDLWGVARSRFSQALQYTLFHNYRLVTGSDERQMSSPLSPEDQLLLRQQIALEYLVRAWFGMAVEQAYGIIKLRNLLLHAKALLFDCDFLGIHDGPFRASIECVVEWRGRWFTHTPSTGEMETAVRRLYEALEGLLALQLSERLLYLPVRDAYRLAQNMTLDPGRPLHCARSGLVLPSNVAFLGRTYFKIQHRFNRFRFQVPFQTTHLPPIIAAKLEFEGSHRQENAKAFPHFMPLATGWSFL